MMQISNFNFKRSRVYGDLVNFHFLLNEYNQFIDRFDAQDRELKTLKETTATLLQKVDSLIQIISNNSCTQGGQGMFVIYLELLR